MTDSQKMINKYCIYVRSVPESDQKFLHVGIVGQFPSLHFTVYLPAGCMYHNVNIINLIQ